MWARSKHTASDKDNRHGFTIVELLIVIVVIGILAAITVVAYRGIQQRATTASYTSAVDQWEKIVRMEKTLQGDDFANTGITCLGRDISDFPKTSEFDEGVCVADAGGAGYYEYNGEIFENWTTSRPSGALPVTTATADGETIKTRGIILSTAPANSYDPAIGEIWWYPQIAGQCGRGVDQSGMFGIEEGALTGGFCILDIGAPQIEGAPQVDIR